MRIEVERRENIRDLESLILGDIFIYRGVVYMYLYPKEDEDNFMAHNMLNLETKNVEVVYGEAEVNYISEDRLTLKIK